MLPASGDPSAGAPETDRRRWPVVHTPTHRRVLVWRTVAVLVAGAMATKFVLAVLLVPDPLVAAAVIVQAVVAAYGVVLLWRWAPGPVARRADLAAMNPWTGPLRDEKLTARMRREIRADGPLAPELRRPAAVYVAVQMQWRNGGAALLGGIPLMLGTDPVGLGFVAFWGLVLLPTVAREIRIVQAAITRGTVPHVVAPGGTPGVTPGEGPPPRP